MRTSDPGGILCEVIVVVNSEPRGQSLSKLFVGFTKHPQGDMELDLHVGSLLPFLRGPHLERVHAAQRAIECLLFIGILAGKVEGMVPPGLDGF